MKKYDLSGTHVAVLTAIDDMEACRSICEALGEQGATVHAITTDGSMPHDCGASEAVAVSKADSEAYRSLVVLADESGHEALKSENRTETFTKSFFSQKKPVSSNCHGTLLLGDFGLIDGRKVSIGEGHMDAAREAGATISANPMTTDEGFTTASPRVELSDFIGKIAEEVEEGKHAGQHA